MVLYLVQSLEVKIWEHFLYVFCKILCPGALNFSESRICPTLARKFLFLVGEWG